MLSSCGPKNYSGTYSALNEFNKYVFTDTATHRPQYQNDSLKCSMLLYETFLGNDSCNVISRKEFRRSRKLLALHHILVKPENFVFKTFEPDSFVPIQITLFTIPFDGTVKDSVILDRTKRTIIATKRSEDKLLVAVFNKTWNFSILQKEALGYIQLLKTGKDYTKIMPADPFTAILSTSTDTCSDYMAARQICKSIESSYRDPMQRKMWLQAAMTCNCLAGNQEGVERYEKEFYERIGQPEKIDYYDAEAIDYLKSQLVDKKVVLMNEAHWQSKHRYLGNLLLDYFYHLGFRYIALECVWDNQDSLNLRKFPLLESGYYSKDPAMSNLIRNALQMGFKVIPYDNFEANNIHDREFGGAKNIYDRIFAKDPNAKALIWAGFGSHISKSPQQRWMGFYLDSLVGGGVFSIDQTEMRSRNIKLASSHYLALEKVTQDSLSDHDILLLNNLQEKDLKVIPSACEVTYKYRLTDALKKKVTQHKELLMMVYNKNEFDTYGYKAVPVKNVLITKKSPMKVKLPVGKYWIVIKSPIETTLKKEVVSID